jgi:uncharacterized membrane protein YuzA (DUF378 family)
MTDLILVAICGYCVTSITQGFGILVGFASVLAIMGVTWFSVKDEL